VFDTLSALRVYNEDKPLQQFSQFLTSKMRNWDVKSVILTLEEEMDDDVVARVSQFSVTVRFIQDRLHFFENFLIWIGSYSFLPISIG